MNRSSSSPIKTGGILYYTISVTDLDQSLEWYAEKLGFKTMSKAGKNEIGKIAFIKNQDVTLKLVQVVNPNPLPPYRSHPGTDNAVRGHKHFSIRVKDGAQTEKELRALKVPIVAVPVVGDTYGIFICDPTGNLIEVLQEELPDSKPDPNKVLGSASISIEGWSHAAISATNMDESIAWYGKTLGFTLKHSGIIPTPNGGKFKAAWLQAPNFCLEVFEFPNSSPMPAERLDPVTDIKTPGNKYYTLSVADMEKAAGELKRLGVDGVNTPENNHRLFIRDNDGILIELAQ
jgi:methylmalonyl-CoA/ethylmalonyl-CoA epimerase